MCGHILANYFVNPLHLQKSNYNKFTLFKYTNKKNYLLKINFKKNVEKVVSMKHLTLAPNLATK